MTTEIKQLQKEIIDQKSQIADLLVLIDTLQTNLRSATSVIPEEKKASIVDVQSYKWSLNWKPN
tara:strand:- start:462 stop:653 length:192 start_codon:yes stop_codon:yes gene_type:complete